jgi:hypothetical protein
MAELVPLPPMVEENDEEFAEIGSLLFGSPHTSVAHVEESLSDPTSLASRYLTGVERRLSDMSRTKVLARICLLTQAQIAHAEALDPAIPTPAAASPRRPTALGGALAYSHTLPPPPPPVRNLHRVGVLRKQPTQFG